MKITSLIFLLVCAVPLFGGLYYILGKDNPKKFWGISLLIFLFLFAFFIVLYTTKDFQPTVE